MSLPLLSATLGRSWQSLFFVVRAIAGGVVLATGFVHVLGDAVPILSDPCLGLSSEYPWVRSCAVHALLLYTIGAQTDLRLPNRCMAAAPWVLDNCFSLRFPSPHLGATSRGSEYRHLSSPPSLPFSPLCWSSTFTATLIGAWHAPLASFKATQKLAQSRAASDLPAMMVHTFAVHHLLVCICCLAVAGLPPLSACCPAAARQNSD